MEDKGNYNQDGIQRINHDHEDGVIKKRFPIIGMGGSAGAFHAFEKFFTHMPNDAGMAFVVVMHLDPKQRMKVSELLQSFTSMPVLLVEDGVQIEQNKVYVIPTDRDMGIHNGRLLLFPASRSRGAHMSIDYFLQSLAEDQWNQSVAIIFSGMGADGETGVRMIKEKLGMAMAQDPLTAEYSSMPNASISTNMVDYILSPEEMPVELIKYLNHPAIQEEEMGELILEKANENQIHKILMILRSQTGHDFTLYKKNTITRRVDRRIAYHQLPDYIHYVSFLRENPHEIDVLFNELLIGVTKFFRDSSAFESLTEKLYALIKERNPDDPIRIWVTGCSTGEEAYSLAIIAMEHLETQKTRKTQKVQIFATDLDIHAIEQARKGVYFENIASEVSAERLERFFIKQPNTYVVRKELREMIVFAQHNLIKDAPFTRLDLLCCRNVMIYLTGELQKKIMPVFHYSLNTKGILFLGPAESVGVFHQNFNTLDSKWKIFERKEGISSLGEVIDFPFHITNRMNTPKIKEPFKSGLKNPVSENFNRVLLEQYTPASLLINDKGDILYINGKTSKFISLNPGEAMMNIYRMAREELKYALGNAIHQVLSQRTKVEISDLKLKEDKHIHLLDFSVDYLRGEALDGLLLVTFQDRGLLKNHRKEPKKDPSRDGAVEELEKELIYTKQQLHTTIEQMETSLEELKSTNEELQSTNEELQSTNEEALTTKEEMQSLNEELMTINLQYQTKAEELTQLNNDMRNLLDNTEIGTIFLDNELKILRYTPQVTKLFNVISGDIGRSISHIVSNFDYPSVENEIMQVIEKLNGKELEVKTKLDEWYNLRIMPYRTMDNFISGAVLTFTKITPVKAMEQQTETLQRYIQCQLDQLPAVALLLNREQKIICVNKAFISVFNFRMHELKELSFSELVQNMWRTNKFDGLLQEIGINFVDTYVQIDFPGAGLRNFQVEAVPYPTEEGEINVTLITFKDQ